jgi:hypothetical protein
MVSVHSTGTSSSAGNSAITRRSRRSRDPSTYRSSFEGSSHSMKTRSKRDGTSNVPSKELDYRDMAGGTEPATESHRTPEPDSTGPAEIVAKFQFTYTKLRCGLELLGWMFSDGSPVPGRSKKVTKFKTELTRLSLNELDDHKHRLKDLRYFVDRSDSHAWAELDELEVSAFCAVLNQLDKEGSEMPPQGEQSRIKLTAQQLVGDASNVWTVEVNASEIMPVPTN